MKNFEQLSRTALLCRDYVDDLTPEEIYQRFSALRVLCVADPQTAASRGGQAALVTLISLLSRMGMQVGIVLPEVGLRDPQPPLVGTSLRAALLASSRNLVASASVTCGPDFDPHLVFVAGDAKVEFQRAQCWRLAAGEWSGSLALDGVSAPRPLTSDWTIGPMVSAALAAGEAFKFLMRRLPLRDTKSRAFFESSESVSWGFDPVQVPCGGLDVGTVDIVSAGAIAQAMLYTLLRLPNVRMSGRIFDNDVTELSNLNRNLLTLVGDKGVNKALLVAERCAAKFQIEPLAERFSASVVGSTGLASRVIVGADHIPSRWEAQRNAGGWLAVGGTSHFSVSASSHRPGQPCCGCLHPVDEPGPEHIPTVSFVSFWAGLLLAVRVIHESANFSYRPERQHLYMTPLRLDQPRAAMWMPVPAHPNCPVGCPAARVLRRKAS